ncbi:MAG TPA: arginine--tRNA ligase [Bacteroidales bacterium]|nr:arginine--tRNA ligase [Bacteroidales bacterium]
MSIEKIIIQSVAEAINNLYNVQIEEKLVQLQETKKEITGDITIVTFPFLKMSKKSPEQTGDDIGNYITQHTKEISGYSVIKGFLNLTIDASYWLENLSRIASTTNYGKVECRPDAKTIMVEYSSPNTNKPLHLGHIRNNLLGYSVASILKANGHKVIMVNLVNDRGIHICKSMLAWKKWGNGATPESTGDKGDHLVGDYYVKFDQEYKNQIKQLVSEGLSQEEAEKKAPVILEAQEMLRKWEAKDPETVQLWEMMNGWVYKGFDETYVKLGVSFDKIYYESQTYLLGKAIVEKGLESGILFRKDDNSVWADLTGDGLDQKLLLRSDGTSVYMTQDLGTACLRFDEYHMDEMVYVVGNEQNYHFQVLSLILQKLGYSWAKQLKHLSYGMVELPSGKMKSREGTVVDADDLVDEMVGTARDMSNELGKLDGYTREQAEKIFNIIGQGALKYFILKVDPKKNMLFDPKESIDFNGNTGPFIQYTYARIQSIMRKAADVGFQVSGNVVPGFGIDEKEIQLIKLIYKYPQIVEEAGEALSPAVIANYAYELAKEFNQFYHDYPIMKAEEQMRSFRLLLAKLIGEVIESSMALLGIEVPERM